MKKIKPIWMIVGIVALVLFMNQQEKKEGLANGAECTIVGGGLGDNSQCSLQCSSTWCEDVIGMGGECAPLPNGQICTPQNTPCPNPDDLTQCHPEGCNVEMSNLRFLGFIKLGSWNPVCCSGTYFEKQGESDSPVGISNVYGVCKKGFCIDFFNKYIGEYVGGNCQTSTIIGIAGIIILFMFMMMSMK